MKLTILFLISSMMFFGCKKAEVTTTADIQETAQQVGDVMASVDEAGGKHGHYRLYERHRKNAKFSEADF